MKKSKLPITPNGHLPPVMRLLHVQDPVNAGTWLADRLSEDTAVEIQLEVHDPATAMSRLREEPFDAVLISHLPGKLDAIELVPALRAGSHLDQPVLVLGEESPGEMTALCLEASADTYLWVPQTTVRTLLWQIARASERHRLLAENRRWQQSSDQQRVRQHQEALHQLRQQRGLLVDHIMHKEQDESATPPGWLVDHFRHLLRNYVVMGCGNLSAEVAQLVQQLGQYEVTLRESLVAHTVAVEELVLGLGHRSAWHVISRGNLLAYELILQMLEGQCVTGST